jgi:hypothetical protein
MRRNGSHVHHGIDRQGRCPAMPLQPSTSTPQAFLMATPTSDINRPWSPDGGSDRHRVMPLPSPDPPGSSWWVELRGVRTLVPHVHLSVWLAGPRPSGSTDQSRRCQGCFPPAPASPGSGCPQLRPSRCDGRAMVVSHLHSNPWRLVAHDVGHPQDVGPGWSELALDQVIGHSDARDADRGAPSALGDQAREPAPRISRSTRLRPTRMS